MTCEGVRAGVAVAESRQQGRYRGGDLESGVRWEVVVPRVLL